MYYFCLLSKLGASIFLLPLFKKPDEVRSSSVGLVLIKIVWVNINSIPVLSVLYVAKETKSISSARMGNLLERDGLNRASLCDARETGGQAW